MYQHLLEDLTQLKNGIESNAAEAETSQLFQKFWSKIPSQWKLKCQVPVGDNPPNPPRDRLRVDLWSRDPIIISDDIITHLKLWGNNPLSFFFVRIETPLSNDPFTRLFRLLHDTSGGDTIIQAIRLRIGQIGLFRLKKRLGNCHVRSETDIGREFLNRIQFDGDVNRAKSWVILGEKHDSLSTDLGGLGSMICIPNDLTLAKLKKIPASGHIRQQAIDRLLDRGINDQERKDIKFCYDVAEKIAKVMEDESDLFFMQYKPYLQMPTRKRKREESIQGRKTRCQVTEQGWNKTHRPSVPSGPTPDGSRPSLPRPIDLLNVKGVTAGQGETATKSTFDSIPSTTPLLQNSSQMMTEAVTTTRNEAQTPGSQTASKRADPIPATNNEDSAMQPEWLNNNVMDTPQSGSINDMENFLLDPAASEIDLSHHLFYPTDEIDLAVHLYQVYTDASADTETYPYHHDSYTPSENLEGVISEHAQVVL